MVEKMTKIEIADRVQKKSGMTGKKAFAAVEAVIYEIKNALSKGEEVQIRDFGAFKVRHKKERLCHNFHTNSPTPMTARKVVTFKPGTALKEATNTPKAPNE